MTAPPFGSYAAYYDLLYRDKDYTAEAKFVDGELQRVRPGARTILEFGCSTGVHAEQLIRLGYSVEGVDSSAGMLAAARVRRDAMPRALAARMGLTEGVWISLGLRAKGHDLLTISACEVRPKPGQPVALVEGA